MSRVTCFDSNNQQYSERYLKSIDEIKNIVEKTVGEGKYNHFFNRAGNYILKIVEHEKQLSEDFFIKSSFKDLKSLNYSFYEVVLEENYKESYANPDKCTESFGPELGPILAVLYSKVMNYMQLAYENQLFTMALTNELFINIYQKIDSECLDDIKELMIMDAHNELFIKVETNLIKRFDSDFNCYTKILMEADLTDLKYLFRYGSYISENEIKTAEFINALPDETIELMANTFVDAFLRGYENGHKEIPLSDKRSITMAYPIGFERVIRLSATKFLAINLKPLVYADAFTATRPRLISTKPSHQYAYDHRFDEAIYFDKKYTDAFEEAYAKATEKHSVKIRSLAGIALQECFGEKPFSPVSKTSSLNYSEEQTSIKNAHNAAIGKIYNKYLPGSAYSFVIVTYPIPEIGEKYAEIFNEIIKVNTLDSLIYEKIHQSLIDALDLGEYVHLVGSDNNKTDVTVKLHELQDPTKETNFENCTADVNVPVGEVFTSPVLAGTNGIIHVREVYLNNLKYKNLEIHFNEGYVDKYTCTNFEREEENTKFVFENLIHPNKSLPLGEFAVGTNTTAYVMSKKYDIANILPILIAEKMGPHFAIGDTCYSWSEDIAVFNPDGKEIIARDNEKSILRKTDLTQAYTYKHTDITIPYDELSLIEIVKKDKSKVTILKDGRFVLDGTEELNRPFEK